MIEGVSKGYEKKLEIQGVGYLGAIQGKTCCSSASVSPTKFRSRFPTA